MQALKKTLNNKALKYTARSLNQFTIAPISQHHKPLGYVRGFRNTQFQEAIPGSMPKTTNPKYGQYNLVTEQFTGPQGFTGEASANGPLRTYMYKKERSIKINEYKKAEKKSPLAEVNYEYAAPNPLRLSPPPKPQGQVDFTQGFIPIAENEHILHYQYSFNASMSQQHKVFHNIDGEMLIQPAEGNLQVITELGILDLEPGIVGVIPKNLKFQVNLLDCEWAQGVITELKNDRSYRLPHRGPLGANGLANPEYFETPTPYVDQQNFDVKHEIICKKQDTYYTAIQNNSPFDVQAWKGNYAPYRFNLDDFVPVIAGNKDHVDPSSHLLFAVPASDGANFVELAVFAPRANITTKQNPTYLPPYDHRNVGKSEIMHYLGGYDARVGTQAGSQTIHEMGVAHGNDQQTFEKAKTSPNESVFLDHRPATMIEITGPLKFSPYVLNNYDSKYLPQLQGEGAIPSSQIRVPEQEIGYMKKITFTALRSSVTSLFDILMPNPEVTTDKNTGITIKQYRNSRGDIFEIQYQEDQSAFWDTVKDKPIDYHKLDVKNPENASDEELAVAARVMKSFFNRGTVINSVDLECENPEATYNYFLSKGFYPGFDKNCVVLNPNAPLNFRFINRGEFVAKPNKDSLVTSIDHTVINVYREQVQKMFDMFPETFWGGDPRDLRTTGVQFDTRVLSSNLNNVKNLIPVNNLDETEEQILHRMQDGDTYLPPYIRDAAFGNQITRGLYDTNRTQPKMSKDGFLQHMAMSVNTNFGDISYHLNNFKKNNIKLIPGPPDLYYELSEVDLSQRILLPKLFEQAGIDPWGLPFDFFNGLLKPKDASVDRLFEIMTKDCRLPEEVGTKAVNAYKQMQPVLQFVGDNILKYEQKFFKEQLTTLLKQQKLDSSEVSVNTFISMLEFNKKKIERAHNAGSLIDFQIIFVGGSNQTGYLDQTFSVPLTQGSEGTSGIFLEFIVRTSYDEIFELIKSGEFYKKDDTTFKYCGAFGQGNFGNLMLGQQEGIKKVDEKIKQKAAQGKAFKLPLMDFDTINTQPLEQIDLQLAEQTKVGSEKVGNLNKYKQNIEKIIGECQKRGLW